MGARQETSSSRTGAFYDRISRAYDLISDASEHSAREAGERALAVREGERVLELGPGTGHSLVTFARETGASGSVIGLDLSAGMLAVARRRLDKQELPERVGLLRSDARALPLADDSVGAAFASFTLELFSDDDLPVVLAELRRVLGARGRFGVVSMAQPAEGEHESLLERAYVWMHEHFPHIVDCRPIDLESVLEANGFRVDSAEHLSIWTMPVAVVVARAG